MRRLKKFLKYLALSVGALIAVALIANAIFVWHSGNRLAERLSKLRAEGEPLSLAELGALPTPPGTDAAAVLKRIEPELFALGNEIGKLDIERYDEDPRPVSEVAWKALEKAYANHPTVVPALAEAAACQSYKSPLNYQLAAMPNEDKTTTTFLDEMLSYVQAHRRAAWILQHRVNLQVRAKDSNGAMRTSIETLRIARHVQKEPMIISHLVGVAIRVIGMYQANQALRAGPVAADLHRELDSELAKVDLPATYRWALRSERAYGLQTLGEMDRAGWLMRAYWNAERITYLDMMEDAIGKADDSFANYKAEHDAAVAAGGSVEGKGPGVDPSVSRLVLFAILKSRLADMNSRCLIRSLRVVNALTAKNLTEVPANLTDLGLPAAAVTDPFVDRPLIVRRVNGQWLVYGVGSNLKDDGGRTESFEDVGYGPLKR